MAKGTLLVLVDVAHDNMLLNCSLFTNHVAALQSVQAIISGAVSEWWRVESSVEYTPAGGYWYLVRDLESQRGPVRQIRRIYLQPHDVTATV